MAIETQTESGPAPRTAAMKELIKPDTTAPNLSDANTMVVDSMRESVDRLVLHASGSSQSPAARETPSQLKTGEDILDGATKLRQHEDRTWSRQAKSLMESEIHADTGNTGKKVDLVREFSKTWIRGTVAAATEPKKDLKASSRPDLSQETGQDVLDGPSGGSTVAATAKQQASVAKPVQATTLNFMAMIDESPIADHTRAAGRMAAALDVRKIPADASFVDVAEKQQAIAVGKSPLGITQQATTVIPEMDLGHQAERANEAFATMQAQRTAAKPKPVFGYSISTMGGIH